MDTSIVRSSEVNCFFAAIIQVVASNSDARKGLSPRLTLLFFAWAFFGHFVLMKQRIPSPEYSKKVSQEERMQERDFVMDRQAALIQRNIWITWGGLAVIVLIGNLPPRKQTNLSQPTVGV
jgi:hypothetical protein